MKALRSTRGTHRASLRQKSIRKGCTRGQKACVACVTFPHRAELLLFSKRRTSRTSRMTVIKEPTNKHLQRVSTSRGPAPPTGSEAVALDSTNLAEGGTISRVMKQQVLTILLLARLFACPLLRSLQLRHLMTWRRKMPVLQQSKPQAQLKMDRRARKPRGRVGRKEKRGSLMRM